jgi:dephospho-CoA kinase
MQGYSLVMRASRHSGEPLRVLLGGGIGCGKSLAGHRFAALGAVVVDADRLGHAVIDPGGEAHERVSQRWPSVRTDSGIDRAALGRIVFASSDQLGELEAMTHPAIIRRIAAIAGDAVDLVVEIPLNLEIPGDWTAVYVDAAPDRCIRRAVSRGLDEESVRRRMDNQPHRCEWLAWADQILENNGTPDELDARVDELWTELRSR